MKEEDLAKNLGLHPKQLRRTLRVLEEELLVIREHRREVRAVPDIGKSPRISIA